MKRKTSKDDKQQESKVRNISLRLVDEGLLDLESSTGGLAERYRRGETPHTIHVWWARRPHSAMRALVYSAIAMSSDAQARKLLPTIATSSLLPYDILMEVRDSVKRMWKSKPRVLDMFGGGGTIPFEAATLGADTYSIDSNELSVFLQTTLLKNSQSIPQLQKIVSQAGDSVLNRLAKNTAPLFPLRDTVFAYIWTYSWSCKECKYQFLLMKRPWLSKKRDRRLAFEIIKGENSDSVQISQVDESYELKNRWTGRNGTVTCPKCRATCNSLDVKKAKDQIVANISKSDGAGKSFIQPTKDSVPKKSTIARIEKIALDQLKAEMPTSEIPKWSGIANPTLYGIITHADFLSPRQRAVLLTLVKELNIEYSNLKQTHTEEIAKVVISILSGLIDQLVDWNCRLSMWISQNEQVGRAFSGPGIPMLWDYAELDPASNGPANLWSKLERIVAGTSSLSNLESTVKVEKAFAQELPFEDEFFDAIVTDPPYYDNLYYNVLADFFYSWKRLLFKEIEPSLFSKLATDSSRELVASSFRSGDDEKAHADYCRELSLAINEAARVLRPDGVFCLVYSHSSIRGWEAIYRAYRSAPIEVASVQPLCIERKARPRAMTSNAVNTCVVFVARKNSNNRNNSTMECFRECVLTEGRAVIGVLRGAGWSEEDIGISIFAKGVGIACNFASIGDQLSDNAVLIEVEKIVQTLVPTFKIVKRKSL
jgi:putative DNA methylase